MKRADAAAVALSFASILSALAATAPRAAQSNRGRGRRLRPVATTMRTSRVVGRLHRDFLTSLKLQARED